jgi:hypothetical protein
MARSGRTDASGVRDARKVVQECLREARSWAWRSCRPREGVNTISGLCLNGDEKSSDEGKGKNKGKRKDEKDEEEGEDDEDDDSEDEEGGER